MPLPAQQIETPCVFLGGDENYAHWLTRYLMRLALLEDEKSFSGLPLLAIDSLKPYQQESLALLGLDEDRLIKVPRHSMVHCAELVVPTCLRTDGNSIAIGARWLREKFSSVLQDSTPRSGNRLLVSRQDAPSRYMTKEEEVSKALSAYGFQTVRLSEHAFSDQIRLFADAEIVVAPHGAGLANMMSAPTDCVLLEIVSEPIANMNDFRVIGQVLGQSVVTVSCQSFNLYAGATNPAAQHDFTVDVVELISTVEGNLPG